MKSQINMMWHNVPHHHIKKNQFFFFRLWNHGLQICRALTNLHDMKKNLSFFSFDFVDKNVLTPFKYHNHYYKNGLQFISLNHYGTLKVK